MSAQSNTLLNRLGFADPDKKLPRHDLACRYVGRWEFFEALGIVWQNPRFEFEFVISKGANQYRQHIGFADVLVFDRYEMPILLIEVKITPVLASDLLRQVKLYRQYLPPVETLAVVDFPVSEGDDRLLSDEGIATVRLGEGFDRWAQTQGTSAKLRAV